MRHAFLEATSARLAARGVATLRYQFPYMEGETRRPPNPPRLLSATVRAAVARAAELAPELPRFAGGKSLGGRMTSTAASEGGLPGVRGLVFFGFPLHAPGKPGVERADHLARVEAQMLFLQGDRDKLAELERLRPVVDALGPRARLHVVLGGDHSFHVLKRSGRSDEEVLDELADRVSEWTDAVLAASR